MDKDVSVASVLNQLQHIFSKYYNWCRRLHQALYSGRGIQGIIDTALPMFENPIYIHDKNYRILAYAENRALPCMQEHYTFFNGRLSPDAVNSLNSMPDYPKVLETTVPAYWSNKDRPDLYSYLYYNLRIEGEYCGRIFIDERVRPINSADYIVMGELGKIVEMALRRHKYYAVEEGHFFGSQIIKVLNGESLKPDIMEQLLTDIGWKRNDELFCIQLPLSDEDLRFNTGESLCCLLEDSHYGCQAFIYQNSILAIANGRNFSNQRHLFMKKIRHILDDFHLCAGISLMGDFMGSVCQYYRQTSIALQYGRKCRPEERVHYFEDYSLDYMLDHCAGELSWEMLCPPPLLRLIQYDRDNNTEFAHTLHIYLECNSSPARAVKQLCVHRSTFLYRMQRIQELIHVDLQDSKNRLHYLMAFRLLDLKIENQTAR